MAGKQQSFIVASRTENVQKVGVRIDAICREFGIPADMREDIVVAVDEAITNIMMHSYQGREDGDIEICCTCCDGIFHLSLSDRGDGFEPPGFDSILEDKRRIVRSSGPVKGGYGLILMHKFMDDIIFTRDDASGRNVVVMKKSVRT